MSPTGVAALVGVFLVGQYSPPTEAPQPRSKAGSSAAPAKADDRLPNPDYIGHLVAWHQKLYIERVTATARSPDQKKTLQIQAELEVSCWRYLSWHGFEKPDFREQCKRVSRYYFQNFHFAMGAVQFREVHGTGGLLWVYDLREVDWQAVAVSAVYRRDLTFRQPAVGDKLADHLRRSVGLEVDKKTLHVEVVAWAPQFFRDLVESGRSPSGYDLLFNHQRFTKSAEAKRPPPEAVHRDASRPGWVHDGKAWYKEDGVYQGQATVVDFPKKKGDFQALFRVTNDKVRATAFGRPIELRHGAIVAGYNDGSSGGESIVSRSTRVAIFKPNQFGGASTETIDFLKAVKDKDGLEQAPKISRGVDPEGDAYELIEMLPAGGLACLLANAKDERIEQAVGDIAAGVGAFSEKTKVKPNPKCKWLHHPNVRNPGDCFRCHMKAYGFIEPVDLVSDLLDAATEDGLEADLKFRDPANRVQFEAFFRNLKSRIGGYRAPVQGLLQATTFDPVTKKAWTGIEWVDAFEQFWDWYDAPVTVDQAARELGVPVRVLKGITQRQLYDHLTKKRPDLESLSAATITARPKQLVVKGAIPRASWDEDVRPLLVDFLVANFTPEVHHEWSLAP